MHATPEFALGRDDFLRLQRACLRRLRARTRHGAPHLAARIALWLLIAGTLFLCFTLADRHAADASALYATAGLAAAAMVLAGLLPHFAARDQRRALLADDGAFLRPHALELTATGLCVRWRTGRSEMAWSEFLARGADDVNHYLYVDTCSAVVVPCRVVEPFRADFERLVAAIPVE